MRARYVFLTNLAGVVCAAAACGIDALGEADFVNAPDRSDAFAGEESDVGDGRSSDDAAIDATVDALDACSSCPLGFACSDAACSDFARAHFSVDANPSGAWTFGYRTALADAGTFVPFTLSFVDGSAGIEGWSIAASSVTPGVFRNPSAAVVHPYGSFTMTPLQMAFHPGPANERGIIRWTAPSSRTYAARIVVVGLSGWMGAPPTTTNVAITTTIAGVTNEVGRRNVGGDGTAGDASDGPFAIDVPATAFAQGDVIDVSVDFGANGNYGFDSTGVDVTIVAP